MWLVLTLVEIAICFVYFGILRQLTYDKRTQTIIRHNSPS